jgi:hypothetical protein
MMGLMEVIEEGYSNDFLLAELNHVEGDEKWK